MHAELIICLSVCLLGSCVSMHSDLIMYIQQNGMKQIPRTLLFVAVHAHYSLVCEEGVIPSMFSQTNMQRSESNIISHFNID